MDAGEITGVCHFPSDVDGRGKAHLNILIAHR
jgi:hypothetical protein